MYDRWEADGYRYPLYQYHEDCLVMDGGRLRPFVADEREQLQGLELDFTVGACTGAEKHNLQQVEDLRCNLVASCFHVPTVMWLLGALLYRFGHLASPLTSCHIGRFFGSTMDMEDSTLGSSLVRRLLLQLTHRGTDIRTLRKRLVSSQVPMQIGCWMWQWSAGFGHAWRHTGDHINILEARALVQGVRARLRRSSEQGCRWLHLVDSLVVMGAVSKGRSSAPGLRAELRKLASLQLVGDAAMAI
eukprot:594946-Amphidinium_carterae.1